MHSAKAGQKIPSLGKTIYTATYAAILAFSAYLKAGIPRMDNLWNGSESRFDEKQKDPDVARS